MSGSPMKPGDNGKLNPMARCRGLLHQAGLLGAEGWLEPLRRRRGVVAGGFLVTVILGGLLAFGLAPVFRATAQIHVERRALDRPGMEPILGRQTILPGDFTSLDYINTQCLIITSPRILNAAIETGGLKTLPTFAEADNPLTLLRRKVWAKPKRRSQIMEVNFESRFAEDTAKVVNAVVESYLDFHAAQRSRTASDALKVLERQKEGLARQLREKEEKLVLFKEANAVAGWSADPDGERGDNVIERKLKDLSEALTQAQIDRAESEARWQAFRPLLAKQQDATMTALIIPAGLRLPESFQAGLIEQRTELNRELLQLKSRYGPEHPRVVATRTALGQIEQELTSQRRRLARAKADLLERDFQRFKGQEIALNNMLDQQKIVVLDLERKAIRCEALTSEVGRIRNLFEAIAGRLKELRITDEYNPTHLAVLDAAKVPEIPVRPNKMLILLGSGLLGLLLGVAGAILLEQKNHVIRSAEQIEQATDLRVLAQLPEAEVADGPTPVISQHHPGSGLAEACRSLRTSLRSIPASNQCRRILITSAVPGEGKTTLSCNLAVSLAQAHRKVLLIDADLRKGTLAGTFPAQGRTQDRARVSLGLGDVLDGKVRPLDAVRKTCIENLDLMWTGTAPEQPSDQLGRNDPLNILETLSGQYESIIIDSPPVLGIADTRILAPGVDGVVIVARAGQTGQSALIQTIRDLRDVGAVLLGVVLNATQESAGTYGYGYGYGARYGYGAPTRRKRVVGMNVEKPSNQLIEA